MFTTIRFWIGLVVTSALLYTLYRRRQQESRVERARGAVKEQAANVGETARDTFKSVRETAGDTLGSLRETASETFGSLRGTAGDTLGSARETAGKQFTSARGATSDRAGAAAQSAGKAAGRARGVLGAAPFVGALLRGRRDDEDDSRYTREDDWRRWGEHIGE